MKLLVAALTLALPGAALAQATSDAPPTPAPAQASAPAAKSAGNTVSGLTVEGRKTPQKACASRDHACVEAVVAELKLRYPKELQKWCDTITERAAMTNILVDDLNATTGSPGTRSEAGMFYAPAVAKVACASARPQAAKP